MKLALLVAIFIGSANAVCPSSFVMSISIPGKCYHVMTSDGSYYFFSAVNYCRNLIHGADILAIVNGFENNEIVSLMNTNGVGYAWIGSVFYDNEPRWITTAAGNSTYSNWGSSNYNGDTAQIDQTGAWRASSVGSKTYSICQIYPNDPTTFPPPQITCPSGWWSSISVRGKCYRQLSDTDFFSAIRSCQTTEVGDSHAELVTVVSQLEMMEIGYSWASMTNLGEDGAWHWIETLHPTDYFGPGGSPIPDGGNCAYLDAYELYGGSCSDTRATICQHFPYEPPIPPAANLSCPQNGIASITEPETCYYILNQQESFQSARNACQALNVGFDYNDLFVPRTDDEYYDFESRVAGKALYPFLWLGLTNSNGSWDWISGRTSNVTNFWCNGQPGNAQNSTDQCGFVFNTNLYNGNICWMPGDCTDKYAAVCQSSNTI